VIIRPARPQDALAIAELDVASWRAAYGDLMPARYLAALSEAERAARWGRDIAQYQGGGRKRWFVGEFDGRISGYALAGIPTGRMTGMLYLLYTLPEAWGSGLGKALLDAALGAFRELEVADARLWVLEGNARARRFYEREGWLATGDRSTEDYGGTVLPALEYRFPVSG
jgi:GNAT superfamily N-acetyltransferase